MGPYASMCNHSFFVVILYNLTFNEGRGVCVLGISGFTITSHFILQKKFAILVSRSTFSATMFAIGTQF